MNILFSLIFQIPCTEIYSISRKNWVTVPDHPVHVSISSFAILAHNDMFYLFGGYWWIGDRRMPTKSIWSLNPVSKTWNKIGEMNFHRLYHSVILLDNFILIAGSWSRDPELKKGLSLPLAE